ncbi:MAG: phage holin family protein [Actinomycetes bacterium]
MTDTTLRDGYQTEATLGALFATASRDLSALVRDEVELAKAEIKVDVRNGAMGGAMFGAAAFVGLLAVILLAFAAVYGLVEAGVPTWLAFLIVTVVLLVVGGVLVLVGRKAVAKVRPPERTIRTSRDTAAFLKKPRSADAQPPTT